MSENLSAVERIASSLLGIGALIVSPERPFTWASGLIAPIYCDNRLTLAHPEVRKLITNAFAQHLATSGSMPDAVLGTATAGIPHAAWLADKTGLPMGYVRGSAKLHGKGEQVEGGLMRGQRVVLVEDTVSTGGSAVRAVAALRDAGFEVQEVLAIFSYEFPVAAERFRKVDIALHALTTFSTLVNVSEAKGYLSHVDIHALEAWHEHPQAWSDEQKSIREGAGTESA